VKIATSFTTELYHEVVIRTTPRQSSEPGSLSSVSAHTNKVGMVAFGGLASVHLDSLA
jgi:hypothetical protein